MRIIFVKAFNSSQQGFDAGQICEMPDKAAKTFIKGKFAKKATKAEVKATETSGEDDK